jgi:hypothetical protein
MGILVTKIKAKPMHASIFTIVLAKKAWAYKSGFIRCMANVVAITKKVNPVVKVNKTQNFGTSKLLLAMY